MPPYFVLLFPISFRENKRKMSGSDLERTTHIWWTFCTSTVCKNKYPRFSPSLPSSENMSSPGSKCVLSNSTSISPSPHGGSWTGMETVSHLCKQPDCATIMGWGAGRPAGPSIALQGAGIFGKVMWKYQGSWHREGSSACGLNLLAGSYCVGCDHLHSGVQGNFLLIEPGTIPGKQLAHGTCASWAIQKHKLSGVFLSPQNTEEAIH